MLVPERFKVFAALTFLVFVPIMTIVAEKEPQV
jgi:hypothetical protein